MDTATAELAADAAYRAACLPTDAVRYAHGTTAGHELEAVTIAGAVASGARTNLYARVAAARTAGRSWSEIGAALGVSKQAAAERFSKPPPISDRPEPACHTASTPAPPPDTGAPSDAGCTAPGGAEAAPTAEGPPPTPRPPGSDAVADTACPSSQLATGNEP